MTRRIHKECPACGAKAICVDSRVQHDGTMRRRFHCKNDHRFRTEGEVVTRYTARMPMKAPRECRAPCRYTGPILSEWRPNPFGAAA